MECFVSSYPIVSGLQVLSKSGSCAETNSIIIDFGRRLVSDGLLGVFRARERASAGAVPDPQVRANSGTLLS